MSDASLLRPSRRVTDDYHTNLMKIIRAKMKGKKIEIAEPEDRERTQVVDLVARLQESLALGKKRAAKKSTRKTTSRRKSA
jgi:non-homologous end joining protein Ku